MKKNKAMIAAAAATACLAFGGTATALAASSTPPGPPPPTIISLNLLGIVQVTITLPNLGPITVIVDEILGPLGGV